MRKARYRLRLAWLLGLVVLVGLLCGFVVSLGDPARLWESYLFLALSLPLAAILVPRRLIDEIRLARLRVLAARYALPPRPAGYCPLDHSAYLESPRLARPSRGRVRRWHERS
jgi:uncharacterized membrane protein YfcA